MAKKPGVKKISQKKVPPKKTRSKQVKSKSVQTDKKVKKTISKKSQRKKVQPKKTPSKVAKSEVVQPEIKVKQKTVNKPLRVIVPIIVIICVIGLIWFVFFSNFAKAEEGKAQLIIESGIVEVKHSEDLWMIAEDGMDLYESDSVRTGNNSTATIILFRSGIIRLDSNTIVTIKELVKNEDLRSVTIQQDAGRTWNSVVQVCGIDNYDVETPTAIASVRGTTFDIDVGDEGTTVVKVIKGIVNVTHFKYGEIYSVQLHENYSVTVYQDSMGEPVPFDIDDWIENNLLKDLGFKGDLKEILYERLEPYMDYLKDDIGMSDLEIQVLIDGFINGDFPIPPDTPDEYKKLFIIY